MDFGSSPTSSSSEGPSESQIVSQIQGEVQLAMMQEYLSTVRDTCFEKCVTKPSTSLSSSHTDCDKGAFRLLGMNRHHLHKRGWGPCGGCMLMPSAGINDLRKRPAHPRRVGQMRATLSV
ncbi:protein translocase subunit [Trebouxia sp. C0009 RCD-2024]